MFLYNKYSNMRTNVYSNNSEVNMLCNRIYKKKWSLCWIGVSTCNSITLALIIEGIIIETSLGVILFIVGICFNLGNKKGRILNYVGNIFVVILVVGICIYLLRFYISGFKMNINDNVIKIEAPSYEIEFNIDDVEGVELIN